MNTQTQIKVLEAAKIVCIDNYNHIDNRFGLCYAIKIALRKYCPDQIIMGSEILTYIPLFTIENAKKYGKSHINTTGENPYHQFWWSISSLDDRIAFLDWMISVLKLHDGILPIKTQIFVLKRVKRNLIKRFLLNHLIGRYRYKYYLCNLTEISFGSAIAPDKMKDYFPLLTYTNATGNTNCPKDAVIMGPWWPKEDFLSRLRFLNRTIKQLKSIQNV